MVLTRCSIRIGSADEEGGEVFDGTGYRAGLPLKGGLAPAVQSG